MIKEQEQAAKIADPYLNKEDTQRVFVNQSGLIWINNEVDQMTEYFNSKKESFWVFEKEQTEESTEEIKPKRGRKKQE